LEATTTARPSMEGSGKGEDGVDGLREILDS
jgi:hypothetical protein